MRNESSRTQDPHLGLRFWVELEGLEIAGFSDCSAISVETEMTEYSEGGLNEYTHKLPGRTKYANITLKRGMDPTRDLLAWYRESLDGAPASRKQVTISLYAPDGKKVKAYKLREAYPVKYITADLKTEAGATAVETLEIAYHGLMTDQLIRDEGHLT